MFFAPFVGVVRETLRVMRGIQAEKEQRNATPHGQTEAFALIAGQFYS